MGFEPPLTLSLPGRQRAALTHALSLDEEHHILPSFKPNSLSWYLLKWIKTGFPFSPPTSKAFPQVLIPADTVRGSLPVKSHLSLKGDGTPLQYCCLENPRDGGAWWAALYGVTQSWTRLK